MNGSEPFVAQYISKRQLRNCGSGAAVMPGGGCAMALPPRRTIRIRMGIRPGGWFERWTRYHRVGDFNT